MWLCGMMPVKTEVFMNLDKKLSDIASNLKLDGRKTCTKGHTLAEFVTNHEHYRCDVCRESMSKGTHMLSCRKCDYDMCDSCVASAQKLGI